jgi:hypothetical protein
MGLRPDPSIFDLDSRHARAHTYHFSIVYIHLNNILITLPTYEEDSCRHTALRLSVRFYYFFPSRSSREGMSFFITTNLHVLQGNAPAFFILHHYFFLEF